MSTLSLFGDKKQDTPDERVLSVAELNRIVRLHLETGFSSIQVQGELSDVMHARSGHVYFTLNDMESSAQIRCVMFRADAQTCKLDIEDGAAVRLTGMLSLYEPRGSFQLIVRRFVPEGAGDLKAQFERLRKKLESEGLIDESKRRSLPAFPTHIGVVTSAEGAAVHDIIRVASSRFPLRITVSPCLVQGKEAPASIIKALIAVQRITDLDVVIIGRGGGSAEDLAAFNDENLARAVAACRVPIVSAVGHEIDMSICDLVADLRASTPSNAAELVVPDQNQVRDLLQSHRRALSQAMDMVLGRKRLAFERALRRVSDPRSALQGIASRFERLHSALMANALRYLTLKRAELETNHRQLLRHDVRRVLAQDRQTFQALQIKLKAMPEKLIYHHRSMLRATEAKLGMLSPLGVLARGYSVAIHEKTGKALLRSKEVSIHDAVVLRLHEGSLHTKVERKDD
ncbi:MAG: exodeoxyribonuclease VII large subunit [Myxococcales bacterium]|nr:MAG: exodeoxyribonuclease VII large subunit [Myxococcales bacterium]